MQITSGKLPAAIKTVIYGPEGIGKSTFAARFPNPLFIDTEGSTTHMDVHRLPKPISWTELLNEVDWARRHKEQCGTLVLDTADWAEILCVEHVCARDKKAGVEDYSYGKGYTYVAEEFGRLINALTLAQEAGINVVVTAHAKMRKFEQPDELGAYDRWEMKLSKQAAPLLKEWADMVLFASYKTIVVNVDNQGAQKGRNKAQGGARVLRCTHHPCWDAKNRFGLPEELPLDYAAIRQIIEGANVQPATSPQTASPENKTEPEGADRLPGSTLAQAVARAAEAPAAPPTRDEAPQEENPGVADAYAALPDSLVRLMREAEVAPNEVKYIIAQKGIYPADTPWSIITADANFMNGWLLHPQVWPQVVNAVRMNREDAPF